MRSEAGRDLKEFWKRPGTTGLFLVGMTKAIVSRLDRTSLVNGRLLFTVGMTKAIVLLCLFCALSTAPGAENLPAAQASSTRKDLPTAEEPGALQPASPAQQLNPLHTPPTTQRPSPLELLKLSISEMQRQDSLLAGYCYLKTVVVEFLDSDLSAKRSEERIVEVTSIPHGPDIEVVTAINGKPIPDKERQEREAEQRRRPQSSDTRVNLSPEDLITQFEWSFGGAELVNGRAATILLFRPKPGAIYKGKDSKAAKFVKRVSGRVWVDDEEHAISRIEFRSTEPVKSIGGLLWTLNSLYVKEERKRLAEGVWVDSGGEYFVDAKALLVKRIVRRSTSHTHNYRKCS